MSSERLRMIAQLGEGELQSATQAALWLGQCDDSQSLSALMGALTDASDALQLIIIDQLVKRGDPRAIGALVGCLRSHSEDIRGEALYAIINIAERRSQKLPTDLLRAPEERQLDATRIMFPFDLEAINLLIELVNDNEPELRIGAAYGLGGVGAVSALSAITSQLSIEIEDDVQTAQTYAIAQLVEAGAVEGLVFLRSQFDRLSSPDAKIAALGVLAHFQPVFNQMCFESAIASTDERLRQMGLIGLAQCKNENAARSVVKRLNDPSSHVRRLATQALGRLGFEWTLPTLFETAVNASAELRNSVAKSFAQFSEGVSQEFLGQTFLNHDPDQRRCVVFIASKLGFGEIVGKALGDSDELVRKQAVLALSEFLEQENDFVLKHLYNALHDPSWKVRVASIEVLRRRPVELDNVVKAHLNDAHHVVRHAARRALEEIKNR